MALALDPNMSFDDKRRVAMARRVNAGVSTVAQPDAPTAPIGHGQFAGFGGENGEGMDFGNGGGQFQAPTSFRVENGAPPVVPAQQQQTVQPTAPVPTSEAPPPALPTGVQRTVAGGIYEGRRGYAGERVFSDNPYDSILTDRSAAGGGLRRRSMGNQNAALNVLQGTQAFGDREANKHTLVDPSSLETAVHYNTTGADPTNNAGNRTGAPMFSRQWEQENQKLPSVNDLDPEGKMSPEQLQRAMSDQISSNKQALAMSRVQRGVATSSAPNGVPGAPGATGVPAGMNPIDWFKAQTNAQHDTNTDTRKAGDQAIDLQKANETRAEDFYKRHLEDIKGDKASANLSPSDQARAARIRTSSSLLAAGLDPSTTSAGREGMNYAAEDLAAYTNPVSNDGTRITPDRAALDQFDVVPASGAARVFGNTGATVRGPAFSRDPASGRVMPDPNGDMRNSTSGYPIVGRNLPPALKAATGGDPQILRALIEHQRQKAAAAAAAASQGAQRRGSRYGN